jgi:S1-C subfamily serine protease
VVGLATIAKAEMRTWTAAVGGFKTEAEYVELKAGNVVGLRLKDGSLRDVPLSKLSEADQAYVRQKSGQEAPTAPAAEQKSEADATKALKAVDDEAERSKTAEEAVLLFNMFLADGTNPESVRAMAREKLAEWQKRVDQGLVHFGRKWVAIDEVRTARAQAQYLVGQGLELVRLSQDQLALEKLVEASRTDPDSIQADFIIATVFAIVARNFDKANQHYDICLRRDPTNVAVLNNLALVEIKRGAHRDAVTHWRMAANLRYDQRIAQNIGRLLDQAGKRRVPVTRGTLDQLSDVYSTMVIANKLFGADKRQGWHYMLIPQEATPEEPSTTAPAVDQQTGEAISMAGTGFVVADNYILTNRHVTKDAIGFMIADPVNQGQTLPATLVASSKTQDLALLQCAGLSCPALPLANDLPRKGQELMVFGYPSSDVLGMNLKSSRGLLATLPLASLSGMMQYNADAATGGAGGPVCDSFGNVVGVHCKTFSAVVSRYAAGIPMYAAMPFIRESVPNYQGAPEGKADKQWSDIANQVGKSTVLILSKARAQDVGLAKRIGEEFLEDRACVVCNGFKKIKCPVRDCARGTIGKTQRVSAGRLPTTGQEVYEEQRIRVQCPNCHGAGAVTCPACGGGGVDPDLR